MWPQEGEAENEHEGKKDNQKEKLSRPSPGAERKAPELWERLILRVGSGFHLEDSLHLLSSNLLLPFIYLPLPRKPAGLSRHPQHPDVLFRGCRLHCPSDERS